MAIGVWAARVGRPLTERETDALRQLLPESRRMRFDRLQKPEKRDEVLCAYTMLHLALRERYGWHKIPEMTVSTAGKPEFPAFPDVHFNISHTAGAVLVGVADSPVGVDIERIRPVSLRAMLRIAGVESERAFFENWVRREARAKCTGNGVGTIMLKDTPMREGERFCLLETFDGYAAGVATRSNEELEPVRKYFLDELL